MCFRKGWYQCCLTYTHEHILAVWPECRQANKHTKSLHIYFICRHHQSKMHTLKCLLASRGSVFFFQMNEHFSKLFHTAFIVETYSSITLYVFSLWIHFIPSKLIKNDFDHTSIVVDCVLFRWKSIPYIVSKFSFINILIFFSFTQIIQFDCVLWLCSVLFMKKKSIFKSSLRPSCFCYFLFLHL